MLKSNKSRGYGSGACRKDRRSQARFRLKEVPNLGPRGVVRLWYGLSLARPARFQNDKTRTIFDGV
jgi:hypothetical protein